MKRSLQQRGDADNTRATELREVVGRLLVLIGENPRRNGLVRTPERVEKMLRFMTQGYRQNIGTLLNGALFPFEYDEMVIV
ncbi:MAG: GTP cyclohydrolase I, partial [Nitrospirae bacterium]|nr:GTP cyclohydrolase I [Nitrospirota bacterium]